MLYLHDGSPAGTKAWINGDPWPPHWTELPGSTNVGCVHSALFPLDVGMAAFDIECTVSDRRGGPPSKRPCRVQYAPEWNRLNVSLTDQAAGAGWYALKLTRRKNGGAGWTKRRYMLIDRLRKDLCAVNPPGSFDAPRNSSEARYYFFPSRIGEPTTLRLWLTRSKDVPVRGTVKLFRDNELLGDVCDLASVAPIPLGASMDQSKIVEIDVTDQVDRPDYYQVRIALTGKSNETLYVRRVEMETHLPPAASENDKPPNGKDDTAVEASSAAVPSKD